jgi:hypothetical protein
MKVVGLNGKEYTLKLTKYLKQRGKCSSYHAAARELIEGMFRGYRVYEEVKLPGTVNPAKKATLFLDFFIPEFDLAIEVHGNQHFEFVPFFHKSKAGYIEYQHRDRCKQAWCDKNNIKLLVLRFDEQENWSKQLHESIR